MKNYDKKIKVGDEVICNWTGGYTQEDKRFHGAIGRVNHIYNNGSCVIRFPFSVVEAVFSDAWLSVSSPIKVGDYSVSFVGDGNVKVGCTTVPFKQLEEIYKKAKSLK